MPFKSEAQRKYLWANEPGIAREWTDRYGSGIAKALGGRIGFFEGGDENTWTYNTKDDPELTAKANAAGKRAADKWLSEASKSGNLPSDIQGQWDKIYNRTRRDIIGATMNKGQAQGESKPLPYNELDDIEARDIANREFAADPTFQTSEEEEEYNEYLRSIGQMPRIKDPNIFQRIGTGVKNYISQGGIGGRILSSIGNQFEHRPATQGAYGYSPAQLNQMNALGGYYSEHARAQRRNQARVNNLIARNVQGKNIRSDASSFINRYGTPQQQQTFNQIQSQPSIDIRSTRVDDYGTSNGGNTSTSTQNYSPQDDWNEMGLYARGGRTKYSQGGLASLWPR